MVLSEPERFVGLAALSTTLSAESAERLSPGEELSRLPVLVQHGTQDQMISVERAQESRDRLEALGVELEYHEYEMGHQVGNESASDLSAWLVNVLKLTGGEPDSDESSDGSTGSP
jgi:phospholipase/carboxylesterase